jgi:hypothetical protein
MSRRFMSIHDAAALYRAKHSAITVISSLFGAILRGQGAAMRKTGSSPTHRRCGKAAMARVQETCGAAGRRARLVNRAIGWFFALIA